MQDVSSCPICTCARVTSFATTRDAGRELSYLVCRRCGHVFQSPRMSPDELDAFYRGDYRLLRQGSEEPIERDVLAQEARAVVTVRLLGDRLPGVTRHLDVGSSSGALLEELRSRYGCDGVGIEPGEAYRRYSDGRGLRIVPDLDQLQEAAEPPFDLVTAMHVVEHMPDPVATLTSIRERHMRPGGFLLLEAPNLFDHQAFELAHLHAFTTSSLRDTVRRAGFRPVWSGVHGGYRSPILRLYITVLAQAEGRPHPGRYLPFAVFRSRLGRAFGAAKRELFTRRYPDWTWQSPERVLARRNAR